MRHFDAAVTGIGSVPHLTIDDALAYAFAHDLPFLPQMPGESMLEVDLEPRAWAGFLAQLAARKTPLAKLHLIGPVTMAKHGVSGTDLTTLARTQVSALTRLDIEPMFFIDEPALGDGPFEGLQSMLETLKRAGAITGVHCCGETNWQKLLSLTDLDIVSFDLKRSWPLITPHLADFTGTLAFGFDEAMAVPSFESTLLTATCGLAGRTTDQALAQLVLLKAHNGRTR